MNETGLEAPTGVGIGLRWEFLEEFLETRPTVSFVEVSPENYMRRGGYYPARLEEAREHYRVITHGLTMSLGAIDPPPAEYLDDLKVEIDRLGTPWHSDHLCFSTAGDRVLHDLLPLKHCQENVARVSDRLKAMQDRLRVPMAFENISWYAHPGREEMPEAEFISRIVDESGCGLLLDVNNVYVNSQNHGFDPYDHLRALPLDRVVQLHVAGHKRRSDGLIIDTHGADVIDPVYDLLEWTLARTGPLPVVLERDNQIPELDELLDELGKIDAVYQRATRSKEDADASRARASHR